MSRRIVACLALGALTACGSATAPGAAPASAPASPPATASTAAHPSAPTFLLDAGQLAALRTQTTRFAPVIRSCDQNLARAPHPVADLNPANHYTAAGSSEVDNPLAGDAQDAYRAALCHRITGGMQYARHAQQIIDAWAATLQQTSTSQGRDALNVSMPFLIGAASWVRGANGWDGTGFSRFLDRVVVPNSLLDNPNNHGMWATLMVAAAGEYSHDPTQLATARTRWQQILAGAVGSDGTLTREVTRSDTSDYHGGPTRGIKGMAYTHYFLLPASMTAQILAETGTPQWSTPSGDVLRKAFTRAAAWTRNPSSFPWWASNHGRLVGVTNASYFPLLLRHFASTDARQVVASGTITADGFLLTKLFA